MSGTVRKPLAWLVEDFALYPRHKVDDQNVSEIVAAIEAGADLPPIVAEKSTGRIVDGFHRSRAWRRARGAGSDVEVVLKTYGDDAEAFADAVRYNASHGRKLTGPDRVRSINRLREFGWSDEAIRPVIFSPPQRITKLSERVAFTPSGGPVELKRPVVHLKGTTVTPSQEKAMQSAPGTSYGLLVRQLLDALREGLLPEDPSLWGQLSDLHDALQSAISQRGAA